MQSPRFLQWILAGFILTSLVSCTTSQPVQRRWKSVIDTGGKVQPHALPDSVLPPELSIGAYSTDSSPLTIKDLPDHAAAAYIEALGKLPKMTPDALRARLSKPISSPKPVVDTTVLNRTLNITVAKNGFQPADRLVRVEIEIKPELNFRFGDYEAAATIYSPTNIETVGATNTSTIGGGLTPLSQE